MRPLYRSIAVAAIHTLLVLSVAGKYALDRQRLPRAWARTGPVDPNLPVRGRYVSLQLEVDPAAGMGYYYQPVSLSVAGGRLLATPSGANTGVTIWQRGDRVMLAEPVAFFIGEHAADPSWRKPGEELWVEVSVPGKGPPRPIRLAIKKDGVMRLLDLR